jgi:hypothetical protein
MSSAPAEVKPPQLRVPREFGNTTSRSSAECRRALTPDLCLNSRETFDDTFVERMLAM